MTGRTRSRLVEDMIDKTAKDMLDLGGKNFRLAYETSTSPLDKSMLRTDAKSAAADFVSQSLMISLISVMLAVKSTTSMSSEDILEVWNEVFSVYEEILIELLQGREDAQETAEGER